LLSPVPPAGAGGNRREEVSASIRQIDNGYIVTYSRFTDGELKSSERYTADTPNMYEVMGQNPSPGKGMMREAVSELERKKR
jgi:hypothetical protein